MRRRFSSADAAWLHMDRPTNLMVINSVMLFDEPRRLGALPRGRAGAPDRPLSAVQPAGDRKPAAAASAEMGARSRVRARAPPAPSGAAGARRRRRAPGARVRPDDDAARSQPAAVAGVHGRRLRRGRRGDHANAPLHRRRDLARARDAVADRLERRCRERYRAGTRARERRRRAARLRGEARVGDRPGLVRRGPSGRAHRHLALSRGAPGPARSGATARPSCGCC